VPFSFHSFSPCDIADAFAWYSYRTFKVSLSSAFWTPQNTKYLWYLIVFIIFFWHCILIVRMSQVQIGTHAFTFDHVYGSSGTPSSAMFGECIGPLVDGLFQGYNATVLAYGQVKLYFPWKICSSGTKLFVEMLISFLVFTLQSVVDGIWEDIYNGHRLQRWLPNGNNSSSHECSIQQDWNFKASNWIPIACFFHWGSLKHFFSPSATLNSTGLSSISSLLTLSLSLPSFSSLSHTHSLTHSLTIFKL